MNKKFLAAGMAAAMAATMLPSMAFADEQPTVTLLVPEYNAGKSLKNEGSDEVIKKVQEYTGISRLSGEIMVHMIRFLEPLLWTSTTCQ